LPRCSKCGNDIRVGAAYCDSCGSPVIGQPVSGEIYRSAGMLASQQRLILAMILCGFGFVTVLVALSALTMPTVPFGPNMNYSFALIGVAMGAIIILIGLGIFFIGRRVQRSS